MTPIDVPEGLWLGRCWTPDAQGPAIVTLRDGQLIDIAASTAAWPPSMPMIAPASASSCAAEAKNEAADGPSQKPADVVSGGSA